MCLCDQMSLFQNSWVPNIIRSPTVSFNFLAFTLKLHLVHCIWYLSDFYSAATNDKQL